MTQRRDSRRSTPADVEARWGLPFGQIIRDLHSQGLSRSAAARVLGYTEANPKNGHRVFMNWLARHPEQDPWGSSSVAVQYTKQTGEAFRDAVVRLAKTHTATQAAVELGFSGVAPLRYALARRGIHVQFQRHRPRRVQRSDVEQYLAKRYERERAADAAESQGFSPRTMRGAVARMIPHLAGQQPAANRRESR